MGTPTPRLVSVVTVAVALSLALSGSAVAASQTSTPPRDTNGPVGKIRATPSTPGAQSTQSIRETLGNHVASSHWRGFKVKYQREGAVSNVSRGDVVKVGVDRGDNDPGSQVDRNLTGHVTSVSTNSVGDTLHISLDGSYTLHKGDQLIVVVRDVNNPPSTGDYPIKLTVNPDQHGGIASALLTPLKGILSPGLQHELVGALRGIGVKRPRTYFQPHPKRVFASLHIRAANESSG